MWRNAHRTSFGGLVTYPYVSKTDGAVILSIEEFGEILQLLRDIEEILEESCKEKTAVRDRLSKLESRLTSLQTRDTIPSPKMSSSLPPDEE